MPSYSSEHNIVLFGGRERGMPNMPSLLIDVYALFSDVSLRQQAIVYW